jgi:hypothetical protein
MTEANRIKYLRVALVVVGLTFAFGVWGSMEQKTGVSTGKR